MMKCKHCNGTGTTNWCVNGTFVDCPYCGGTGEMEMEMTNEEWFCSLPTEEKAEFLSKIEEQYPCGSLLKCDVTCGYHSQCRGDDVAPTNKEAWVEWLKQPHTTKE